MRRRREGAPRTSDESKAPCLRRGNPGKGSAKPRRDRSRMRRRLKLRLQHSLGKLGALTDTQIQPRSVKTYPVAPQSSRSSEPRASEFGRRPEISTRPKPFPETNPITIEGRTVRDVVDATVILEGKGRVNRALGGTAG
jgi:hypothetical protein